jgi:hypothetical protein
MSAPPKLPLEIEHKNQLGTLSICVENDKSVARRTWILTFFFEHLETCRTYSRSIKSAELKQMFPIFQTNPWWIHKYIENKPVIHDSTGLVIVTFAHPEKPGESKIYIPIHADDLKRNEQNVLDEQNDVTLKHPRSDPADGSSMLTYMDVLKKYYLKQS